MRAKTIADWSVSVALVVAASVSVWSNARSTTASRSSERRLPISPPPSPVPISSDQVLGDTHAPVVIVEFSDFQCPYCARFATQTLPVLRLNYFDRGLAQLVFKHLPGNGSHPLARKSAEAAVCASRIGRFRDAHDGLFELFRKQRTGITDEQFRGALVNAGLDNNQQKACFEGDAGQLIQQDVELAKSLGVRSTPTFFIGRRGTNAVVSVTEIIEGAKPLADFVAAIDKLASKTLNP